MEQRPVQGGPLKPPADPKEATLCAPCAGATVLADGQLPLAYGEDYIVLMARDPLNLFAYWEITPEGWARCREDLPDCHCQLVLRIHHLPGQDQMPAGSFDISMPPFSVDWHINTGKPGGRFRAEIGIRTPTERFRPIAVSNIAETPVERALSPLPLSSESPTPGPWPLPPPATPGTSPGIW